MSELRLAKPCIDLGLFTSAIEKVEPFWRDELGLEFDHLMPLDHEGVQWNQHRYRVGESIIKLNARPVDPAPSSGYRELLIARPGLTEPRSLADPDGNRVTLVPPGRHGVTGIGLRLGVRSPAAFRTFFRAIGLADLGDDAFGAGESVLLLEQDDAAGTPAPLFAPGWRYLTFQIYDAGAEQARFLDAGARAGIPVRQLREIVRAAMLRDPDDNWIELSQRATLVGQFSAGDGEP